MAALGESLARGQTYKHEISIELSYDSLSELINFIKECPKIGDKILSFIATFEVTGHFSDRVRLYNIFYAESFEEVLEHTLTKLHSVGGDFFGIDYKFYYACKFLVRAFPDLAVKLLEELIAKATAGEWNEANENLRPTMLLIATISHRFLRYFDQCDINMQLVFLKSMDLKVRAASSAALIQGLLFDRRKNFEIEDLNKTLSLYLSDEEYRLSLAAFNAELYLNRHKPEQVAWKTKSFEMLALEWKGSENLVERVIKVLSGRLPFNWSYTISIQFLDKLLQRNIITVLWCFNFWNNKFIRKIAFHKKYVNNGSESLIDHFSQITDIELTLSILHFFPKLDDREQTIILELWFITVKEMWSVINKPFAYHSNFNSFDEACNRTLWLTIILELLTEKDFLKSESTKFVSEFLKKFEQEVEKAKRYQSEKWASPILNLKESINN